jgi:hypothetical protein
MGYTHGWAQTRPFTDLEWAAVRRDISRICRLAGAFLQLSGPAPGNGPLVVDGIGEDGYETFRLCQNGREHAFCKTERRPFDVVVTASLCYLASVWGNYDVHGDGNEEDFAAGLALARQALPDQADRLARPVLE